MLLAAMALSSINVEIFPIIKMCHKKTTPIERKKKIFIPLCLLNVKLAVNLISLSNGVATNPGLRYDYTAMPKSLGLSLEYLQSM